MPDIHFGATFNQIITSAVRFYAENGYTSDDDLAEWLRAIRAAAERDVIPDHIVDQVVREKLGAIYTRLIDQASILRHHPGVPRFTIDRVRPDLRAELDRRIFAAADLIKLNQKEAVSRTMRRFSGWASSIPPGGDERVARNPVKSSVRKELAKISYERRRVDIDQGHKLVANLNEILATGSGAIAGKWQHHHVRYPRPAHLARDGEIFLIRSSWADEAGFVRPGEVGYTDEVERVGELPMCRCSYIFYSSLRQLPPSMLTEKGRLELQRLNALMARAA